jgi:hypothetical protein
MSYECPCPDRSVSDPRSVITGRPATVLRLGSAEETIVIRFDDCPDDEYFAHERFISPLVPEEQP